MWQTYTIWVTIVAEGCCPCLSACACCVSPQSLEAPPCCCCCCCTVSAGNLFIQSVLIFNMSHFPNCTKFDTAHPRFPGDTDTKCEVDRMSSSRDMQRTYLQIESPCFVVRRNKWNKGRKARETPGNHEWQFQFFFFFSFFQFYFTFRFTKILGGNI